METFPSISIIIPTLNAEKLLPHCLQSVKNQNYPTEKMELLVVDDKSTDQSREIAKEFGAKVLISGFRHIERSKSIGLREAKNDLVLFMDSDNILPEENWLKNLVRPFLEVPDLVGAEPIWFHYNKEDTITDRYSSLFGVNDPIAFYLGRRDRLMWTEREWNLCGRVENRDGYYLVQFEPRNIPTLGSIGFMTKRSLIQRTDWDPFLFHMDSCAELIRQGHNKFAMVKLGIVHHHSNSVMAFLKKLKRNIDLYLKYKHLRKYVWNSEPFKLIGAIIVMSTLIKPTWDSLKGYRKVRDPAWFLHPLFSLLVILIYGLVFIRYQLSKAFGGNPK